MSPARAARWAARAGVTAGAVARNHRAARTLLATLALLAAGCAKKHEPVIPHAASVQREVERHAIAGRDTTQVRISYPEFVGARTPEALDSLNAEAHRLSVAPIIGREPATDVATLADNFIRVWADHRDRTRSRSMWRWKRDVWVLADTFGVVTLARSEAGYLGGAHGMAGVVFRMVDADSGRTLGFDDLFRAGSQDSLSVALEPIFRAARGLTADTSLAAAGFSFPDGRFHVNGNLALVPEGVRWHFDGYEIAPWSFGPTDLIAPFDLVRPFAREDGPLRAQGK